MSDVFFEEESTVHMNNADDMIRANGEAEARVNASLKNQVASYENQLEELRELYRKNSQLVEELRRMNVETTQGIQDVMKQASVAINSDRDAVKNINFDGVRTDLNSVKDTLLDSAEASKQRLEDLLQQSDEFSHKENVRVYRNIQAATDQLIQKQTEELTRQIEGLKRPEKAQVTPVQVMTLVVVLLILVWNVCDSLGIISLIIRMLIGG